MAGVQHRVPKSFNITEIQHRLTSTSPSDNGNSQMILPSDATPAHTHLKHAHNAV